jgi:hypothetical protein
MAIDIVKTISALPLSVQRDLESYPMADADGKYQVGCIAGKDGPAPLSRLIFAAVNEQECFVHFESGGFAHTYSGRHYKLDGNKAELLEAGYVGERCADVDALKAALAVVDVSQDG